MPLLLAEVADKCWLLPWPLIFAWFWAGLLILALALTNSLLSSKRPALAFATAMVILSIEVGYAIEGDCLGRHLWFLRRYPQARAVVLALEERWLGIKPESDLDFERDGYAPRRVIFRLPGDLFDTWTGIAYDPTGELDAFDGDRGNRSSEKAFGASIRSCEPLGGGWYLCWLN